MDVRKRVITQTAVCIIFFLIIAIVMLAWQGGCAPWRVVAAIAFALIDIILPGTFWLQICRTKLGLKELCERAPMSMMLLLGTGFFALISAVSFRLENTFLLDLILPVFAVLGLWSSVRLLKKEKCHPQVVLEPLPMWIFAAMLLVYLFVWIPFTAHPQAVGATSIKQDFLWNVGNVNSFFLGFPPQDIRFEGVRLHYHYLNELLCAGISAASGVHPYDLLGVIWPLFCLSGAAACLYEFGHSLYKSRKTACALLLLVFFTDAQVLYHATTNVNSVATAILYSSIWLSIAAYLWEEEQRVKPISIVLGLCASVLLLMAKDPVGLILILALACAAVWRMLMDRKPGRMTLFAALQMVTLAVVYPLMFSSGANQMGISVSATLGRTGFLALADAAGKIHIAFYWLMLPIAALLFLLFTRAAVFVCYFYCAVRRVKKVTQISGMEMLIHASIFGSLLAFFIFDHYAYSQVYFLFLATQMAAVITAPYIAVLPEKSWKKRVVLAACALGIALCAGNTAVTMSQGVFRIGQNIGLAEKDDMMDVLPDHEQAAQWLEENMQKDETFAVNRYRDLQSAEGNSNLYTAFSGRQSYMEGWLYAVSNMGVPEKTVEERRTQTAIMFSPSSTPEQVLETARAAGVDYLVFDELYAYTGKNGPQFDLLEPVLNLETVKIYRVPPS